MNEQNQEFDPRDRNRDGKVSVKERLQDAADTANEFAQEVKESAEKLFEKKKA